MVVVALLLLSFERIDFLAWYEHLPPQSAPTQIDMIAVGQIRAPKHTYTCFPGWPGLQFAKASKFNQGCCHIRAFRCIAQPGGSCPLPAQPRTRLPQFVAASASALSLSQQRQSLQFCAWLGRGPISAPGGQTCSRSQADRTKCRVQTG